MQMRYNIKLLIDESASQVGDNREVPQHDCDSWAGGDTCVCESLRVHHAYRMCQTRHCQVSAVHGSLLPSC